MFSRSLFSPSRSPLEMWGGVECTLNRVGEDYFDQLQFNGHYNHLEDLDAIAALGIRTLRYPILWEKVTQNHPDAYDWSFPDERLERLRQLQITPIAGLVHHGSGPSFTNLLDPLFPEKLAVYARAVAERYPWLEFYTPVNEPLTTARFSALYGHWYPHGRDSLSFLRALINQSRGTVLAMREIRKVNPQAKLMQTEDMGCVRSTAALAYQADFENERRWLSLDLLCGQVDREHAMTPYLRWAGLEEEEFLSFDESPCRPDIIGINYYLMGERYLDERMELYPEEYHGGNDRQPYCDVPAVRFCDDGLMGVGVILRQAWERYHLPLAITEAHLSCTREEQIRWLWEIWNQASNQRRAGVDVRAVTAWSLLGAYNWDNLVMHNTGSYEPGAFDLRNGKRHKTGLADFISELAHGHFPYHPILATPGWWRQPSRLHSPVSQPIQTLGPKFTDHLNLAQLTNSSLIVSQNERPVIITGARGTLGQAFARICTMRHLPYVLLNRQQIDIADKDSVAAAIEEWKPWAIINAAGYVKVDEAESSPHDCFRENTLGPEILANACARHDTALITFSSDLVFDGTQCTPYIEGDLPNPLNVYGQSKMRAERCVLATHPKALVIRTSAFFGPWDEYNFAAIALSALESGQPLVVADDAVISPTYVPDLVHASLDLLIDGASGIWHLANEGEATWFECAQQIARMTGNDTRLIEGCPTHFLNYTARRPLYSVLGSTHSLALPPLDSAFTRYFSERTAYLETSKRNPAEELATICF